MKLSCTLAGTSLFVLCRATFQGGTVSTFQAVQNHMHYLGTYVSGLLNPECDEQSFFFLSVTQPTEISNIDR